MAAGCSKCAAARKRLLEGAKAGKPTEVAAAVVTGAKIIVDKVTGKRTVDHG